MHMKQMIFKTFIHRRRPVAKFAVTEEETFEAAPIAGDLCEHAAGRE